MKRKQIITAFNVILTILIIVLIILPIIKLVELKQQVNSLQDEVKLMKYQQELLSDSQVRLTKAVNDFIDAWQVDIFQSSAYSPLDNQSGISADSNPQYMSTMEKTKDNIDIAVAVDPNIIPYYSPVWIQGVGWKKALDTGGAIKDKRIDISMEHYKDAMAYGRKEVVVVWPKQKL